MATPSKYYEWESDGVLGSPLGSPVWDESNPRGRNWRLETIRAPGAWSLLGEKIHNPVKVGIIDAGFRIGHEDLSIPIGNTKAPLDGKFLPTASDYSIDPDGIDRKREKAIGAQNHGTHVAGIIGATGDNGIGLTGVMFEGTPLVYRYSSSFLFRDLYGR